MQNIFIFHGTEGYPEENWFPWLKQVLEENGYAVHVPHFPSPPIVPAKISEWHAVLENYKQFIDKDTVFIGHSLGGLFLLKILEETNFVFKGAIFVGTPIGVQPILNHERDSSFTPFEFNWEKIKSSARNFVVFQSDNDPYVGIGNGEALAKKLGVPMTFVPNAGHFNKKANFTEFPQILEKLEKILA